MLIRGYNRTPRNNEKSTSSTSSLIHNNNYFSNLLKAIQFFILRKATKIIANVKIIYPVSKAFFWRFLSALKK